MAWVIEARVHAGVHIYIEIWNDSGHRVSQINGLAYNPSTGAVVTMELGNESLIQGYHSRILVGNL